MISLISVFFVNVLTKDAKCTFNVLYIHIFYIDFHYVVNEYERVRLRDHHQALTDK